jgi:hypothetical protein
MQGSRTHTGYRVCLQLLWPFSFVARIAVLTNPLETDWKTVRSRLNLLVGEGEEGQGPSAAQFPDTQKGGDTDNGSTNNTGSSEDAVLRCLRAPLTEIAWIAVNEGASLEAVQALLGKYVTYANQESSPPIAAAQGQDPAISEEELFLVIGWNTLEVCRSECRMSGRELTVLEHLLGPEERQGN